MVQQIKKIRNMKTKYTKPHINVVKVLPVVMQNTSIDTSKKKTGDARDIAASRENDYYWDEEDFD